MDQRFDRMDQRLGRRSYAVVAGLRRDDRIQDRVDAGEVLWYQLTTQAMQAD